MPLGGLVLTMSSLSTAKKPSPALPAPYASPLYPLRGALVRTFYAMIAYIVLHTAMYCAAQLLRPAGARQFGGVVLLRGISWTSASHPITSSAWNRSADRIVKPRAWAVLRLMTSSNCAGYSTGRAAGLAPLIILSTYSAAQRYLSSRLVP